MFKLFIKVDSRIHHWGNYGDASYASLLDAGQGRPILAKIGTFPIDESLYDVCDMAVNISEWTSSIMTNDRKYISLADETKNYPQAPIIIRGDIGFRLVRSVEEK